MVGLRLVCYALSALNEARNIQSLVSVSSLVLALCGILYYCEKLAMQNVRRTGANIIG